MASLPLVPPVADLISQGDAAADVSVAIGFYEAAKKRVKEFGGSAATDLLCKLSAAYLARGSGDDIAIAVAYTCSVSFLQPSASTFLHYGKAKLAQGVHKRTESDCGESMRRSFREALSAVDKGLALAPGDEGLTVLRTEIEHLAATLKASSPPCDMCSQPAGKRCSRCGLKTYCSTACQRLHWPVHKPFCRAPARPAGYSGCIEANAVVFGDAQTFGFYPESSSMLRSGFATDLSVASAMSACETSLLIFCNLDEEREAALRTSAAELNAMRTVDYKVFLSSLVGSIWEQGVKGAVIAIGAGLNPNLDIHAHFVSSLLGLAVTTRDLDAVRLLLAVGAQVDRGIPASMATPLILAASSLQYDVIEELVDAGADLRAASNEGFTALYFLLMSSSRSGSPHAHALSPLPSAARALCYKVMQKLCARGAPLSSLNCHGLAPLHVAAAEGDVTAIAMLVAAGANVLQPSGNGATPLAFALREGHHKAAALLTKLSK